MRVEISLKRAKARFPLDAKEGSRISLIRTAVGDAPLSGIRMVLGSSILFPLTESLAFLYVLVPGKHIWSSRRVDNPEPATYIIVARLITRQLPPRRVAKLALQSSPPPRA